LTAALWSCAHEIDQVDVPDTGAPSDDGGGTAFDGGKFSNAGPHAIRDAAQPSLDAFFINDPAPPMCGENGGMLEPEEPGGSALCPDDKNREGCPCPKAGMKAACWPGRRLNRDHGICKDGVTTCSDTTEFGLQWGACEGYVLPEDDAVAGPAACRCFSAGQWTLSNIGPCIFDGPTKYLYSSGLNADGTLNCDVGGGDPPAPEHAWSTAKLKVDCAGQFRLCYTIKAGDVNHVKPDDCVITQSCVDTWYPKAGVEMKLDDLPSWTSPASASACVAKFISDGGYGEMSVQGRSAECDDVDDGMGHPYVFQRTDYCKPTCPMTPDLPECVSCSTGGSGMFGN
jgi:hypothetical protein